MKWIKSPLLQLALLIGTGIPILTALLFLGLYEEMQQDLENARYATARAHDAVEKMLMLGCHVVVPCEQRQPRACG